MSTYACMFLLLGSCRSTKHPFLTTFAKVGMEGKTSFTTTDTVQPHGAWRSTRFTCHKLIDATTRLSTTSSRLSSRSAFGGGRFAATIVWKDWPAGLTHLTIIGGGTCGTAVATSI